MWGRQSYRFSDYEFKAASRDGFGTTGRSAMPTSRLITNASSASSASAGGQRTCVPDSVFLPPMSMTCGERLLKNAVEGRWKERRVIMGRVAMLTRPHNGRGLPLLGHCERGCDAHSYFNTPGSTLPAAMKTGKLTLRPDAVCRPRHRRLQHRQSQGRRLHRPRHEEGS